MSKYFSNSELACNCCGSNLMKESFLAKLDRAREIANIPFIITSGYRCNAHNRSVGGKQDSAHTLGRAVDIKCLESRSRWLIVDSLIKAGFNRIGIAKTFIHVDDDDSKDKNVIWEY